LILAALSFVSYWKVPTGFQITEKDIRVSIGRIMSPAVIGAALILVLGILGALFVRSYTDSLLSLLSWLSIAIFVALIIVSRRIPERLYPLLVFVIALTLLYNRTLTSPYLSGLLDGHYELYFATAAQSAGYWDPSFSIHNVAFSDYFAMLSITMLPNVYSILLNINLVWVFKVVSPFIFAFVPVGLYEIYKTQIRFSSKAAFLATFLFMSFYAFYNAMPWLTRQQIAELFVVLVVILITSKSVPESKKTALLILFIGSLVVSHYSMSYIFLMYLAVLLAGSVIIASRNRQIRQKSISAVIVTLAMVMAFSWYLYASGGTPYQALFLLGGHTYNSLLNQLIPPLVPQVGSATLGLIQVLNSYWQAITEILMTIGLGFVIWRRKTQIMTNTLLILSLASFALLVIITLVPSLGGAVGTYRTYTIALLFLAPLCIIGVEAIFATASSKLHADKNTVRKLKSAALIGVLIPYFLLQRGFFAELTEHPSNYAFLPSQNQTQRVLEYRENITWSYTESSPEPAESVYASMWLSSYMGQSPVFAELSAQGGLIGYGLISPDSIAVFSLQNLNQSAINAYTYLGPAQVSGGTVSVTTPISGSQILPVSVLPALTSGSRIYSNGLAEVYYHT